MDNRITAVTIFLTWKIVYGMKVLESTLPMSLDGQAISGARLLDDRKVKVEDISLCMRFNYKLLGGYEGRSRLITIEDWREGPGVR